MKLAENEIRFFPSINKIFVCEWDICFIKLKLYMYITKSTIKFYLYSVLFCIQTKCMSPDSADLKKVHYSET